MDALAGKDVLNLCRNKTPLPSPLKGRSYLLLKQDYFWKTVKAINRLAPFPFGKGGGIGPTHTPINRHSRGEVPYGLGDLIYS